jgi:hypothetical protein
VLALGWPFLRHSGWGGLQIKVLAFMSAPLAGDLSLCWGVLQNTRALAFPARQEHNPQTALKTDREDHICVTGHFSTFYPKDFILKLQKILTPLILSV